MSNQNELHFEAIKNAIDSTKLKIKLLGEAADLQNRLTIDPNTRTSDVKAAREAYRSLTHKRGLAATELKKIEYSRDNMSRRLTAFSSIELEKSWLNKSVISLQSEANSISSEIKITDIEIDKIDKEVSNLKAKMLGLVKVANDLEALKRELDSMKISRSEESLFEVNITRLDKAIQVNQAEIVVKRNKLQESHYLATAIDEKMYGLSEAREVLNFTRKTQVNRWASKHQDIAVKGYMKNVSKLMTSLKQLQLAIEYPTGVPLVI